MSARLRRVVTRWWSGVRCVGRDLAAHRRALVVAGVLLLLVGSREVLQSINALTATMRPPVCESHGVVDLQPTLGNLTSGAEVEAAVATWQHYELEESAGTFVGTAEDCEVQPSAPDGSLTLGSTTASRWLVWDLVAFAPVYPLVIALVAWWYAFGTSKRWRIVAVVGAVVVAGADIAENLLLRRAIVTVANATATDDAETVVPTGVLNVVSTVKWVVVVLLLVLLALRGARHLDAVLSRGAAALKTVALAWPPAVAAIVFVVAMLQVEQVSDAVRRWGTGQLVATTVGGVVFAAIASVASAGAVRPQTERPSAVQGEIGAAGRYGARRGLLWLLVTGLAFVAVAGITGWRGVYVPGVILIVVAVASMFADATIEAPVTRSTREDSARRRSIAGLVGAVVLLGLGLGMIRAAGRSDLFLPDGHRDVDVAQLVVGLVLCATAPVAARCLHLLAGWVARLAGKPSLIVLAVMAALSVGPVAVLMFDSVTLTLAPMAGTVVMLILFLASVCTLFAAGEWFAEWLTRGAVRYDFGLPPIVRSMGLSRTPLGGLVVVWFLLAGLVDPGGYHSVRTQRVATPAPSYTLEQAVGAWLDRAPARADGDASPRVMLIVGASGGGVRAAYWTAAVLDCVIERAADGSDPCGGAADPDDVAARRSSLFLMSGVSGGSLGLVEYVTAVATAGGRDRDDDGEDEDDGWSSMPVAVPSARWYGDRIGDDFLAPTAAGLLFDDVVQGFLRDDSGTDRADLLEQSWEAAWPDGELEAGFLASQRLDRRQPVLLLNGYSVEDGCRFAVTPLSTNAGRGAQDCDVAQLAADGDDSDAAQTLLNGTTDLHDFLCAIGEERASYDDVRLSTAALLSARFPYVSPSGRLVSTECGATQPGGDLTYVVDGGYRESSSASAVVELMPTLERAIMRTRGPQCVVPFYVQIDNGYATPQANTPDASPEELLVPPSALSASRDGQSAVARTAVARAFNRPRIVSPDRNEQLMIRVPSDQRIGIESSSQRWMVISPRERPGAEAPLGWVLSQASQDSLDEQLTVNARQIEYLRALLDGTAGVTCAPAVLGESQ